MSAKKYAAVDQYLTKEQAAEVLKISTSTLNRLIKQNKLVISEFSAGSGERNTVLIDRDDIDAFVEAHKRRPKPAADTGEDEPAGGAS